MVTALNPASVLKGHINVGDHIGFINEEPVESLAELSSFLAKEHDMKPFLTSVPFGIGGATLDGAIRHRYGNVWSHEVKKPAPLKFNSEVYYGSGVCVPPTVLVIDHQSFHSSSTNNLRQHRIQHASVENGVSRLSCCHGVLLNEVNIPEQSNERYKSCFVSSNASNYFGDTDQSAVDLHCLPAKDVLAPRTTITSHGLLTARQMCSSDADCSTWPSDNGEMTPDEEYIRRYSDGQRCVHPLTSSPLHLFSIRLLPVEDSSGAVVAGRTVLFEGSLGELMANFELGELDLFLWLKNFLHSWIYEFALEIPKKIAVCLWLSIQVN